MGKWLLIIFTVLLIGITTSCSIMERNQKEEAERKTIESLPTLYIEGIRAINASDYDKAIDRLSLFHYKKDVDKKNNDAVADYINKNYPNGKHLFNYANAKFHDRKAEFNLVDKYVNEIPDNYSGEFADDILKIKKIDWAKKASDHMKLQVDMYMESRR